MIKAKLKDKPLIFYLFSLYFISKPFYMLPSGLPQVADAIMVIIIIIFLFNYNIKLNKMIFLSFLLILYVLLVNSIFAIIYSDSSFFISAMFYVFNILILIITINLYRVHGIALLKFIFYGVVSSVFIQILCSLFYTDSSAIRQTLFFNNPNQLGYYALLSLSLIYVINTKLQISNFQLFIYSIGCLYLTFLSVSNAAILASILMIVLYFSIGIFNQKSFKYILLLLLVSISLLIVFQLFEQQIRLTNMYENIYYRFTTMEVDLESISEERRYDRLTEYPQYLIFGAGEGLYHERFGKGEIHSTLFSFLFSYGLIGFSILIFYLFLLIYKANLIYYIPLLSIFIYGLTHNGIRQGSLWVILGIIFVLSNKIKENGDKNAKDKLLLREG